MKLSQVLDRTERKIYTQNETQNLIYLASLCVPLEFVLKLDIFEVQTNAMNVFGDFLRHVIIDNSRNVFYIEATGGYWSRHQYAMSAILKKGLKLEEAFFDNISIFSTNYNRKRGVEKTNRF